MGNPTTPRPKRLPHPATEYYADLQAMGHNMERFGTLLIEPARTSPAIMGEICHLCRCDIGDLLSAGIGRNNTFQELDALAETEGLTLGLVSQQ